MLLKGVMQETVPDNRPVKDIFECDDINLIKVLP